MYEIDLLKGQGIPARFRPESAAAFAAAAVIPAVVAVTLVGLYLHNRALIAAGKKGIESYERQTLRLTDASAAQKAIREEHAYLTACLAEVNQSIKAHTQWSGVLRTIAESLPASVQLDELRVEQRFTRHKVPKPNDPKKTVTITLPARTLYLTVRGSEGLDADRAVNTFREQLWQSEAIGSRLENIKVAKQVRETDNRPTTTYEISCVFKPEG